MSTHDLRDTERCWCHNPREQAQAEGSHEPAEARTQLERHARSLSGVHEQAGDSECFLLFYLPCFLSVLYKTQVSLLESEKKS